LLGLLPGTNQQYTQTTKFIARFGITWDIIQANKGEFWGAVMGGANALPPDAHDPPKFP